jgi:hypothetical protein
LVAEIINIGINNHLERAGASTYLLSGIAETDVVLFFRKILN